MTDNIYNTNAAADFLHALIPDESAAYWSRRLINARRADRKQLFELPFTAVGKSVFYDQKDLERYAEFEKARRLGKITLSGRAVEAMRAFGIGEANGGTNGRAFTGATVVAQTSSTTRTVFVQTILKDPLLVFAMTPEQAVSFGSELIEAGEVANRINAEMKEE